MKKYLLLALIPVLFLIYISATKSLEKKVSLDIPSGTVIEVYSTGGRSIGEWEYTEGVTDLYALIEESGRKSGDGVYVVKYLDADGHAHLRYIRFISGKPSLIPADLSKAKPDTIAPTVPTGLLLISKTSNAISFSWTVSTDARGVTGYKIYVGSVQAAVSTSASHVLTGLNPNTAYTLTVSAYDAAGNNSAQSTALAVTTDPLPDTQAPSAPATVTYSNLIATSVSLYWTAATDNVGVSYYRIYQNGALLKAVTNVLNTVISGLSASVTYTNTVRAVDAAGNASTNSMQVTYTTPAPDLTAPSVPGGLYSSASTTTSVTLTWSASTDNVAVTGYKIYRNSNYLSTVTGTNQTVSGLTSSTYYHFTVSAIDASANESVASTGVGVTTASNAGAPARLTLQAQTSVEPITAQCFLTSKT
jgi:chitodextrinase